MLAVDWDSEISAVRCVVVYEGLCDPRSDILCHFIDQAVVHCCNLDGGSSFRRVVVGCSCFLVASRCPEMNDMGP